MPYGSNKDTWSQTASVCCWIISIALADKTPLSKSSCKEYAIFSRGLSLYPNCIRTAPHASRNLSTPSLSRWATCTSSWKYRLSVWCDQPCLFAGIVSILGFLVHAVLMGLGMIWDMHHFSMQLQAQRCHDLQDSVKPWSSLTRKRLV